uniref:Rhamnosyl O-methyltransferase n=1 Tax=Thermodesulfobacterium geofontis TaxID=1295609 RepID=A0A7V5XFC0_9BACT
MIPFIILGMPRTGSTFLAASLAQNQDIKVFGEIFHPLESERKNSHYVSKDLNGNTIYYPGGYYDAIKFLYNYIWNDENSKYKAVGFKLFAQRVECKGTEKLFWRLKEEIKDLHIICIERKNLLDVFVSIKKAEQSKIWTIYRHEVDKLETYRKSITPIKVEPEVLKNFFYSYKEVYRFYSDFFKDLPFIKVFYENLVNDLEEFRKIFDFLGVEPIEVDPVLVKQNVQPHEEFILNFKELKAYFQGTEYEVFFNRERGAKQLFQMSTMKNEFIIKGYTFIDASNIPWDQRPKTSTNKIVVLKPYNMLMWYKNFFNSKNVLNIMELGIAEGGSAIALSLLLNPKKFVTVDIKPEDQNIRDLIKNLGLQDKIKLYFNTSQSDAAKISKIIKDEFSNELIDLVIDDASHLFEQSLASFEIIFPYLKPGKFYVIEDWGWLHNLRLRHYKPAKEGHPSLTQLAFLLIMAFASDPKLINKIIFVNPSLLVVQKGEKEVNPESFSLRDYIKINNFDCIPFLSDNFRKYLKMI